MSLTAAVPEVSDHLSEEARSELDEVFASVTRRQDEVRARTLVGPRVTEALLRKSFAREELERLSPRNPSPPREQLDALLSDERFKPRATFTDSPTARAVITRPHQVMDGHFFIPKPDRHLHVLGPPYVDRWMSPPHVSGEVATIQNLTANRQTGDLRYFMGSADGATSAGVGVWAEFVPTRDTQAQPRAYAPFNYQYDLRSQYGYTAHGHGGFGILVLSWNRDGTGRSKDLDHRYRTWADGTGWWDHHTNPSDPSPDDDNAYLYGHEAPYFNVRADRIYRVCFWAFGGGDSGGGYFGNAISVSVLNAAIRFVVIGEQ